MLLKPLSIAAGSRATCVVVAMAMALMAVIVTDARQASGRGTVSGSELFQQAAHEEDATGNLESAIALYQRVLAASPARDLAAKARLQIALCYQKLGRPEARAALEAVVRDYGDQKPVADKARERLTALGAGRPAQSAGFLVREIWSGKDLADRRLAERRPWFSCQAVR